MAIFQTAKAYIRYRHERNLKRKSQWQMDDLQKDILYKKYVFLRTRDLTDSFPE